MAVATRIDSFIAPNITQQSFYDGLKQAFTNAGYPAPFDDYTSGTERIIVYAVVIDATKLAGTAYLRIRITTALVLGIQIYSGWSTSTRTGSNGSTEIVYTALVNNIQINLIALNANPEYKFVLVQQSAFCLPLGYFSPVNKPSWWDLNSFPYAFLPDGISFNVVRTPTLNPYGNSEHDIGLSNATRLGTANRISNRRDILQGLILLSQSNAGLSGRTSDDMVLFSGSGTTRFDILQVPGSTNQYLVLNPSNGGLALRVA